KLCERPKIETQKQKHDAERRHVKNKRAQGIEHSVWIERFHVYGSSFHEAVIEEQAEEKEVHGVRHNKERDARGDFIFEESLEWPTSENDRRPERNDDRHNDCMRWHGAGRREVSSCDRQICWRDDCASRDRQGRLKESSYWLSLFCRELRPIRSPGDADHDLCRNDADHQVGDPAAEDRKIEDRYKS